MFRIRRQKHEPRIELAPLIDVMLFLLTFFIYQVMVTERVDLIPMELRAYRSGTAARPAPAATISIDLAGWDENSVWFSVRLGWFHALSGPVGRPSPMVTTGGFFTVCLF